MKLIKFLKTEEENPEKKSKKIKLNFFRLICCIGIVIAYLCFTISIRYKSIQEELVKLHADIVLIRENVIEPTAKTIRGGLYNDAPEFEKGELVNPLNEDIERRTK